jgi:hypothetical protein
MKYVPVKPHSSLMAVNVAMFGATAAPMEGTNRKNMATLYAVLLPRMSLSGDHMREENPMATSTPALVMSRISEVVLKSTDISGVAISIDVLANVTQSVSQLTTNKMTYFRHIGRSMLSFGGGATGSSCRSVLSESVMTAESAMAKHGKPVWNKPLFTDDRLGGCRPVGGSDQRKLGSGYYENRPTERKPWHCKLKQKYLGQVLHAVMAPISF